MKKYKFTILGEDAEKMWDFAKTNQVNIHHIRTLEVLDKDPMNMFKEKTYTYEGFMDKATFVAFCLTIPVRSSP
jgi:hypothetical protein